MKSHKTKSGQQSRSHWQHTVETREMPAEHNLRRRIYGVMTATLQSWRPKHPSDLPINPLPSFPTPLINRRAAAAPIPKRHIVPEISSPRRKICSSPEDDENRNRVRASISSADTGWFSSGGGGGGGDEESEALFSTDSSTKRPPHARRIRRRRRVFRLTKRRRLTAAAAAGSNEVPARLSAFDELIACAVEGKVKESFAVVKRSQDPYEDFKESMMEMILEKQMFDRKDLEQLLECFLSLNSRRYHGIIVLAFSQIWEALFSPAARPPVAT